MAKSKPPRLAVWLLRLCLSTRSFEAIAGDLFEECGAHSTSWFWKQAFSALLCWAHFSDGFSRSVRRPLFNPLENACADFRYALRTLGRTPTLTGAILIATALGIGVNTGVFSLFNAMILRPLPVKDAGNVITIYQIFHNLKERHIDGER